MKSHFIMDLADGQVVASLFLVREKEIRTSAKTGKPWLQLELADRTGTISAKMWDNFAGLATTFECHDVVQILRLDVKAFRGGNALNSDRFSRRFTHKLQRFRRIPAMAVDRRDADGIDAALQTEKLRSDARGQKSSVQRSHHHDLTVVGNTQLGDFSFNEPLALQALDGIPPQLSNAHA